MQKLLKRVPKPLVGYVLRCLQDKLPFIDTFLKLCAVSWKSVSYLKPLLSISRWRNPALFTYLLAPWGRVLLEKLTGFAVNQEIPHILWNP